MKAPVRPELLYSGDPHRDTVSHWSPCEGLLQSVLGRRFYVGACVYVWAGHRMRLLYEVPGEFPTADAALMAAVRACSSSNPDTLEEPNFSECLEAFESRVTQRPV